MKKFSLFFCVLIVLIAHGQSKSILRAFNNYDYEIALNLISKENKSDELTLLKAKCYKNLAQYSKTVKILEELLEKDSLNTAVLMEYADCLQISGNVKKSNFIYKKLYTKKSENQYFLINYLNTLYKLQNWSETKNEILNTFQQDTIPVLYSLLGDCYSQQGITDSAIIYYNKAIRNNPEDYNTVYKLSRLYLQTEKYIALINCTNDFIAFDSNNNTVNQYNGIGYCFNQDFNKAITILNKVYKNGDKSYITNYYLGVSYFGKEEYYPAYEHLFEAYKRDSSNVNLIYYLGQSSILSGKFTIGIAVLNRGLDLIIPNDTVLYNFNYKIALGNNRLGKYKEAIKNYELCLKYKSDSKISLYNIANIYDYSLKNPKQALNYYNLFLETFPNEPKTNKEEFLNELSGTYYSAVKNRIEELKTELFFKK